MAQFGPGSRASGLPSFLLEGIELPVQKENVRQARRKEVDVTAYSKLRFADFVDQMINHGKGTYEHKTTGTVWFKEGDMLMRTDDEDVLMVRSHMLEREAAKKKKPSAPPAPKKQMEPTPIVAAARRTPEEQAYIAKELASLEAHRKSDGLEPLSASAREKYISGILLPNYRKEDKKVEAGKKADKIIEEVSDDYQKKGFSKKKSKYIGGAVTGKIFRDKKNKKGMFIEAADGDVRVACQQVIDAWAECPFSTLVEIVKYGVDNDYDCDAVCEAVHDIADVRVPDSAIDKLCGVLKNKDADEVIEQYDGQDFNDIMCELTGKEKKAALNDDYFGSEGDDETVEIGTRQAAFGWDPYEDEARAAASWEKEYDRTHNTLKCHTCNKTKEVPKNTIQLPCSTDADKYNHCGGYMTVFDRENNTWVGEDNYDIGSDDNYEGDDETVEIGTRQAARVYTVLKCDKCGKTENVSKGTTTYPCKEKECGGTCTSPKDVEVDDDNTKEAQLGILPGLMEMLQGAGGGSQGICPNCVKVVRIKSAPDGCPMCGGAMSDNDLLDDMNESEAEMKDVQVDLMKEDLTKQKKENSKDEKENDKDEKDDVEEEEEVVDDAEFESMEDAIASLYSEDGKESDDDEESDDDDEDEGKEISALFTGADEVRNTRAQDYED